MSNTYDDMNKENRELLDWDSEIERENEFTILPEGEYPFKVVKFERSHFEGSDKMPACKMAILTLEVGENSQTAIVTDRLYLHTKSEWKLSQFFIAIGEKKHGERVRMNWPAVTGATGRCKITVRQYNGKDYNNISAYLEPSAKPRWTSF